jgi:hypothetical protein
LLRLQPGYVDVVFMLLVMTSSRVR